MPATVSVHGNLSTGKQVDYVFHERTTVVAGRGSECEIRLPEGDRTASRRHFLLDIDPPEVRMKDLGGQGGTFVDGVKYGGGADGAADAHRRAGPEFVAVPNQARIVAGRNVFQIEVLAWHECGRCGERTPDPELCGRCSDSLDDTDVTQTDLTALPRCERCSAPASSGAVPPGPYICPACAGAIESDPIEAFERRRASVGRPSQDQPHLPGYEIICQLGTGGMGAVYLGRRLRDSTFAAVKVLASARAEEVRTRQRFEREARLVEQLDHPSIVHFLDRSAEGDHLYLAMEFCPGGSVAALAQRRGGQLTAHELAPLTLQILEALRYAHDRELIATLADGGRVRVRGLVHRDIKPENIMIAGSDRRRVFKLADFGLAKAFRVAGLSGITELDTTCGTLVYMAPEQALQFREASPDVDLWAFAASLWELYAGADPRDIASLSPAEQYTEILVREARPLRSHATDVPAQIASVIDRALVTRAADRYPDAASLRAAFQTAFFGIDPHWNSGEPGTTAGTVLLPAAVADLGEDPVLFHVGFGAYSARIAGPDVLERMTEMHRALSAHIAMDDLRFLKCTGNGFLGACSGIGSALSAMRGVLNECSGIGTALRAAVHRGTVSVGDDGDVSGMEIDWLLAIQDVEDRMRAAGPPVDYPRLPRQSRLLVTPQAHECASPSDRHSLVSVGSFELPVFRRPERLWCDVIEGAPAD